MTEFPEIVITPADNLPKPPGQGGSGPNWGAGSGGWGGRGAGWGGTADFFPSSSDYPSGTPLGYYNGPGGSSGGSSAADAYRLVPSEQAHYYSGYWAGVQGALYGFGPPAAPPIHSFGFAIDVLERITAPRTSEQPNPQNAAFIAFGGAHIGGNLLGLWLTPSPSSWSFGNGAEDWPADLPDWGERTPGPLPQIPRFNPIAGNLSDFPTALRRSPQLVNPELGANELDPSNFVGPFDVERLIFDPINAMTNADAERIGHTGSFSSVATPGNIISDITPPNLSSNIVPGNPDAFPGLLSPSHGPTTSFILLDW